MENMPSSDATSSIGDRIGSGPGKVPGAVAIGCAGGGLFGTPMDMARFFAMVANGGVGLNGRRVLRADRDAETSYAPK
ncbi:MAG: hypothetical protein IJ658_05910 [Kiritimatiellae bacterium]|nr:hypothetical protein [Kiritimatiellia bacterium]